MAMQSSLPIQLMFIDRVVLCDRNKVNVIRILFNVFRYCELASGTTCTSPEWSTCGNTCQFCWGDLCFQSSTWRRSIRRSHTSKSCGIKNSSTGALTLRQISKILQEITTRRSRSSESDTPSILMNTNHIFIQYQPCDDGCSKIDNDGHEESCQAWVLI